MKVLLINKYLYPRGGDAVYTLETGKLLANKGYDIAFWGMKHSENEKFEFEKLFVDNVDYQRSFSIRDKIKITKDILYSQEAKQKISRVLQEFKPDIVHLNNIAHQLSPSIIDAIKKHNIPVIMTVHDYKMVCPCYTMLRNGSFCEKCKNGKYFWCFLKRCTKNSRTKSLINTIEMYLHHKILDIYKNVDLFIVPSRFTYNKLQHMGFKGNLEYLSNFAYLNSCANDEKIDNNKLLYFGRLAEEKGLVTLIDAVKGLPEVKLNIVGDGEFKASLLEKINNEGLTNVNLLGFKTGLELENEIQKSIAVILPSECYENSPLTILEAFAQGRPVIGARLGGIPELVIDGKTGYTFEHGNVKDLRGKIVKMISNSQKSFQMGQNAREIMKNEYDSAIFYEKLMKIYTHLVDNKVQ